MSSNSENTDKKPRVMGTNNDAEKLKSHGKQNFEDEATTNNWI